MMKETPSLHFTKSDLSSTMENISPVRTPVLQLQTLGVLKLISLTLFYPRKHISKMSGNAQENKKERWLLFGGMGLWGKESRLLRKKKNTSCFYGSKKEELRAMAAVQAGLLLRRYWFIVFFLQCWRLNPIQMLYLWATPRVCSVLFCLRSRICSFLKIKAIWDFKEWIWFSH